MHVSIVFSFLNSLKNSQCHQCSVCFDFYLDTKIILSYFLHGNISYHILVYNNAFYPIVIWIIINIKTGTITDIEHQFHAFGLVKDMFWRIWPSQRQLRGIYSLLYRVPESLLFFYSRCSEPLSWLVATFPYLSIYGLSTFVHTTISSFSPFWDGFYSIYYLHSVTCRNLCSTH